MAASIAVDPAVSRTPLPANAADHPTVCVLCSHNCGLRVDVAENRITAIRADESNPITKGYVCNKGFSIGHYIDHAQRLQHPLKRQADGSFARISWDTRDPPGSDRRNPPQTNRKRSNFGADSALRHAFSARKSTCNEWWNLGRSVRPAYRLTSVAESTPLSINLDD